MSAAQGIDFRKQVLGADAKLGHGTRGAYALVREEIPFIEADTVMSGYIETSRQLIASGMIVQSADRALAT
jgi:histidine ammonia-lyase